MLDWAISFPLWWTMMKMAIFTQKCEQKWLKIKNVLGGKKIEKLTIGGGGEADDYSGVVSKP